MNRAVSDERLQKYFGLTRDALEAVRSAEHDKEREEEAADILDLASRYFSDAEHFRENGDAVLAYGALNFAHGLLDAGARTELFKVKDNRLFTVDED